MDVSVVYCLSACERGIVEQSSDSDRISSTHIRRNDRGKDMNSHFLSSYALYNNGNMVI